MGERPSSDIQQTLTKCLRSAIARAIGDQYASLDPQVRPSHQPKFGDYQANLAMSLAKKLGKNPRDIAQGIVDQLETAGVCHRVEIAGPGFINLYLSASFLDGALTQRVRGDDRLGTAPVDRSATVVVDYSGPNVAKEMHVGHLRSTVIGDCIARVLEFQGHRVIRQNHLGDWGTQFGMLIEVLQDQRGQPGDLPLDCLYQNAKKRFDADAQFADRARERVVLLQQGDLRSLAYWEALVKLSKQHFQYIYDRLKVRLVDTDYQGESRYNTKLPEVVKGLEEAGLLQTSRDAKVVFPDGFHDRDGNPQAMIVQKRDGGYLYATTDLAAARYRIDDLGADRIVYVTDARQSQHFSMLFAVLRQARWATDQIQLDHVIFGTVLGKDHKPFKTRQGGTVKLIDLLNEAQDRARRVVEQKNPQLPADQQTQIAQVIGIGALKYADLSSDRVKDYVFDWDRMLSFEGNTAPYLQNAYVRIRSIFRKGGFVAEDLGQNSVSVGHPAERVLAVKILQFPEVIEAVANSLEPHRLCTYLYELGSAFHQFYEKCPVLNATDQETRDSRLALCALVGRTLKTGLDLLGIGVVEQM